MNAEQRANIGRGVKEANRRKRLSKAMKESWRRRRGTKLTFGGKSIRVKIPTTVEEYDKMAGKSGSVLNDAMENIAFRKGLAEFHKTGKINVELRPNKLVDLAVKVLGTDKVQRVLKDAIINKIDEL